MSIVISKDVGMLGNSTFNLTPRHPNWECPPNLRQPISAASIASIFGGTITGYGDNTFDRQYFDDRIFFSDSSAGDRTMDVGPDTLRMFPHIRLSFKFTLLAEHKQLVLGFRFSAISQSSLAIREEMSSDPLTWHTLVPGHEQFLVIINDLPLSHQGRSKEISFWHVTNEGEQLGGSWSFNGIGGSVV